MYMCYRYGDVVKRGWAGLVSTVLPNGTVTGVCCGTNIQPNTSAYYERPTFWQCSGPGGAGAVLYAAVDVAKLGIFFACIGRFKCECDCESDSL